MDLLKIGHVNACEMAFKIDEAMWKTWKLCGNQIVLLQDRKRAKTSFESCGKKKKPLSIRSKPQSACAVTSGYCNFTKIRCSLNFGNFGG